MAGVASLDLFEVAMIKRMAALRPRPSNRQILSYFTRPGRGRAQLRQPLRVDEA